MLVAREVGERGAGELDELAARAPAGVVGDADSAPAVPVELQARRSLLTLIENSLKDMDEGEIEFIHVYRDIAVIKKSA